MTPESADFFNWSRVSVLVADLFLFLILMFFLRRARRNTDCFIRPIKGLTAIHEAIGRATEMGKGVLFVPGLLDANDLQTLAGVNILGHVARKTAELSTPLHCPMARPFVMTIAQETVKQAYLEKGRMDSFRPDRISYLTADQFGFAAGVSGILLREKPGACFYFGSFQAESLILSETGTQIDAMQIAGTADVSQIPFFIVSCDHTLIGEELFAASAFLSRNPDEMASLKGQDTCKMIIIFCIVLLSILVTLEQFTWFQSSPWHGPAARILSFFSSKP